MGASEEVKKEREMMTMNDNTSDFLSLSLRRVHIIVSKFNRVKNIVTAYNN